MTVALETGVQNTAIAIAIVDVSFQDLDSKELFQAQLFPVCWGILVLLEALIGTIVYRHVHLKFFGSAKVDDGQLSQT